MHGCSRRASASCNAISGQGDQLQGYGGNRRQGLQFWSSGFASMRLASCRAKILALCTVAGQCTCILQIRRGPDETAASSRRLAMTFPPCEPNRRYVVVDRAIAGSWETCGHASNSNPVPCRSQMARHALNALNARSATLPPVVCQGVPSSPLGGSPRLRRDLLVRFSA